MKCYSCGKEYDTKDNTCPYCGCMTFVKDEPKTKTTRFLEKQVPWIRSTFTVLNLILVIFLNLAVFSILANVLLAVLNVFPVVWAHYVIAGLTVIYIFLKTAYLPADKKITVLYLVSYVIIATVVTTKFINRGTWALGYATPSIIAFLTLTSVISYFKKNISATPFFIAILVNTIIMILPFVFSFIWEFSLVELILIWSVSGISTFILINFALVKVISLITHISKKF